jgi:hypothetical protein
MVVQHRTPEEKSVECASLFHPTICGKGSLKKKIDKMGAM